MTLAEADRTAADVAWDLEPLVDGRGQAGVDALLDEAELLVGGLEVRRGTIAGLDAGGLATFMHELAELNDMVGRAGSYAGLALLGRHLRSGAGCAHAAGRGARHDDLATRILFFELEWAEVDRRRASTRSSPTTASAFCRHYLRSARRYRPHLLTEPEERVLTEKSVTGSSAWSRLFSELTSAITRRPRRRRRPARSRASRCCSRPIVTLRRTPRRR